MAYPWASAAVQQVEAEWVATTEATWGAEPEAVLMVAVTAAAAARATEASEARRAAQEEPPACGLAQAAAA